MTCSFWKPTLSAVFRAAFQEAGRLLPQLFQEREEWRSSRQGWAQRPHPLQPDPGGGQGMVFMPTCERDAYFRRIRLKTLVPVGICTF